MMNENKNNLKLVNTQIHSETLPGELTHTVSSVKTRFESSKRWALEPDHQDSNLGPLTHDVCNR